MPANPHGGVFPPGLATGIGRSRSRTPPRPPSCVLRVHPDLPSVPQLAVTARRRGRAVGGRAARDHGRARRHARSSTPRAIGAPVDADVHHRRARGPARLPRRRRRARDRDHARQGAGRRTADARRRAGRRGDARRRRVRPRRGRGARRGSRRSTTLFAARLRGVRPLVFLDEPALVLWRRGDAPIEREDAVDLLSGALAACTFETGVHVCGDGDVRLAFEAGSTVLGLPVSDALVDDVGSLVRHLDADGWIAWGAVPTDRPVGESPEPLWRRLVTLWCELTRRGCEPLRLRNQAIITPACGLAGARPDAGRARAPARGRARRPRRPRRASPPASPPARSNHRARTRRRLTAVAAPV